MSGMAAKGCPAARVAVVALLASRALAHVVYPTPEPTPQPTMIRTEVGYDSKTCRGGLCTRDATRTCVDESPGWVFTFPSGGNSTCFGLCYSSVNRNMFHNRTAKFSCEVAVDAGVPWPRRCSRDFGWETNENSDPVARGRSTRTWTPRWPRGASAARAGQGRTRERNSQLQRLLSRPFSTRFG